MAKVDRASIITANWKMYKTIGESIDYLATLKKDVNGTSAEVWIAVPFTALAAAKQAVEGSSLVIGAQNMNDAEEGAFTGEISAKMLLNTGAQFVLLGHSERRHVFRETDEFINRKVHRAVISGIRPVLCIGETLGQRDQGETEAVLKDQLTKCLEGMTADELNGLVVAYEPVWAIGTDRSATPEQAQEAHTFCRKILKDLLGADFANKTVIQYGGSVKPANARTLLEKPDIDGLLVGGASLQAESFAQIVNCMSEAANK